MNKKNDFIENMEELGYKPLTERFLVKKFSDIVVNITIDDDTNKISAITGYNEQNEVISIPPDILNNIQEDIQKAL